jgi:prepilin-type N-terminal cleavage/methylation domain-containing protein
MKNPRSDRGVRGFTLIELLTVMALMLILMLFAVPTLQTTMRAAKIRGIASETATLMRQARLEAIKYSCPAIVRIVPADADGSDRVQALGDCNGDGLVDAGRSLLGTYPLPNGVHFLAPGGKKDKDSVGGFSPDPGGGAAKAAIFLGDGSIQDFGGFHFGDQSGNYLEVWVAPKATARVEVHKCLACTNSDDRGDWYAVGDNDGKGKAGAAWSFK